MDPLATFLLDGLIAVLLIATIWYCSMLNRRLSILRDSNTELHKLVGELDLASRKAHESATVMKSAGENAVQELQRQINEAHRLAEELISSGQNSPAADSAQAVTGTKRDWADRF